MKQGYFQEENGIKSVTRLFFAIGLTWTMLFVTYGAIGLKWTAAECIAVFSALSVAFIGLKLGQKAMESKPTQPTDENNTI